MAWRDNRPSDESKYILLSATITLSLFNVHSHSRAIFYYRTHLHSRYTFIVHKSAHLMRNAEPPLVPCRIGTKFYASLILNRTTEIILFLSLFRKCWRHFWDHGVHDSKFCVQILLCPLTSAIGISSTGDLSHQQAFMHETCLLSNMNGDAAGKTFHIKLYSCAKATESLKVYREWLNISTLTASAAVSKRKIWFIKKFIFVLGTPEMNGMGSLLMLTMINWHLCIEFLVVINFKFSLIYAVDSIKHRILLPFSI